MPHPSCYLLSVIIASERNSFDIFSVLVVLYYHRLIFPQKKKLQFLAKVFIYGNFKTNDKISVEQETNVYVMGSFAYN